MSVFSMAFNNFKNNLKNYTMFIFSMVFSVVILSNFYILMEGEAIKKLGEANSKYTDMILSLLTVVLGIFIFFFIWYTSNIFLKNRKKEIGLYTFMGVDSKTIGKMYFFEMMFIGVFSGAVGTAIGALLSKFFQMIVFSIADFDIDVKFDVSVNALIKSFLIFIIIFAVMSIKGFINIVRSKVIDLLNAGKKAEKMPEVNFITYIVAAASLGCIGFGIKSFYDDFLDIKAILLIVIGTYGAMYALIPGVLKILINNKFVLYKGENVITLNSLAYRIKKNYTTYATIGILTACTMGSLAAASSMKILYEMSEGNDNLYSLSFASKEELDENSLEEAVLKSGNKKFDLKTEIIKAKSTDKKISNFIEDYIVLSYSQFKDILKNNGNEDSLTKINEDMTSGNKAIYIERPGTLMSLINSDKVNINNKEYSISEGSIRLRTLGSVMDFPAVVVNDEEYEKIKSSETAEKFNFYGIKIEDDEKLLEEDEINKLYENVVPHLNENIISQVGVYKLQSVSWLKLVYAIMAFLFLVFVLAEVSIIYTKIFSDASEDKDKYKILKNIGIPNSDLSRSIRKETAVFYILPIVIGASYSFVLVKVLEKVMSENLLTVYVISVAVSLVVFAVSYLFSVKSFRKIADVNYL